MTALMCSVHVGQIAAAVWAAAVLPCPGIWQKGRRTSVEERLLWCYPDTQAAEEGTLCIHCVFYFGKYSHFHIENPQFLLDVTDRGWRPTYIAVSPSQTRTFNCYREHFMPREVNLFGVMHASHLWFSQIKFDIHFSSALLHCCLLSQ